MLIIRRKIFIRLTMTKKMMKNCHESVEIIHSPNWPYIPDHLYRIWILGGSGSEKTNVLLNLIKHQPPDIDNIHLYVKGPFELK